MKVNIGPYRNWFGPYQCVNFLRSLGFTDAFVDRVAESLPAGPFNWLDGLKKRRIRVQIHDYDTWSMDHTLSMIIHPMLVQLQETKHGSPFIEDEDVPDELKSTNAPPKENEWDTDEHWHKRWEYVLNEMIYSFEKISKGDWDDAFYCPKDHTFDDKGYLVEHARIKNGLRLFGKYYENLWD